MAKEKHSTATLLTRGIEKIIVKENVQKRLDAGDKFRIKFGIDPTGRYLHLGHMVVMRKLREFQELGHTVILLIGDFTARIGDPTGRLTTRPPLSEEEIKNNMQEYTRQAGKILDIGKTEIRYNMEWFGKMNAGDLLMLSMQATYSQVSAREDFKKRIAEEQDFTVQEFLYPMLQGYDSVALKADIEIGGTDQEFNMLMGRRLQKKYSEQPQDVITCPLLLGTDGRKMSKSYNNYIAVMDEPKEMYGKVMSSIDDTIIDYFSLCTDVHMDEIRKIKAHMLNGSLNPRDAKARLAREIVSQYHDTDAALQAEKEFEKIFKEKNAPTDIPIFKTDKKEYAILDLLLATRLVTSKTEAKRLIAQNGVKIDGMPYSDETGVITIKNGMIIQVGKRKFVKLTT